MRWKVMLDFLRDIFSALSHAAGDSADKEEPGPAPDVPTVDTVTGWAGEPPYRYIDVSRYQGKIDWAQVAAAGYKGAMLKTVSTNRKLSKRADGLYIDSTFETNYHNAKAAGLDVGVYYYTYATSEAMADAELSLVREAVRGKELTMPLAVDVEENKLKPMSTLDLTNLTAYALEQVEKMGFTPSCTPTPATNTSWIWPGCPPGGTYGLLTTPARPRRWISSTMLTSTPARAAYLASPVTLTST